MQEAARVASRTWVWAHVGRVQGAATAGFRTVLDGIDGGGELAEALAAILQGRFVRSEGPAQADSET
eukprot:2518095-Pyramimonas_sp.AAC.1